MDSELELFCGTCHRPVVGDTGFIGVRFGQVTRAEAEHAPRGSVVWEVFHDRCNPYRDEDGYQIDAIQIGTRAGIAKWTDHLSAKRWVVTVTDWEQVVQEACGLTTRTLPRIRPRVRVTS